MTDIKELILAIVCPLVSHPNLVRLEVEETDEFIECHLAVSPLDIGRIIGKQGRVAKAIRTVVYSVRVAGTKKIRLNIIDRK